MSDQTASIETGRQFILDVYCDDENVDPQPSLAVVTLTPRYARHLLAGINEVKRLTETFSVHTYSIEVFDGSADFVSSSGECDHFAPPGEADEERDNRIEAIYDRMGSFVGLVAPGEVTGDIFTDEEMEAVRVAMEVQTVIFKEDLVKWQAAIKHTGVYCSTEAIGVALLEEIAGGGEEKAA